MIKQHKIHHLACILQYLPCFFCVLACIVQHKIHHLACIVTYCDIHPKLISILHIGYWMLSVILNTSSHRSVPCILPWKPVMPKPYPRVPCWHKLTRPQWNSQHLPQMNRGKVIVVWMFFVRGMRLAWPFQKIISLKLNSEWTCLIIFFHHYFSLGEKQDWLKYPKISKYS